jgi:alpha-ribazole phosphatase
LEDEVEQMLELILVRHGETDSNKKGTYLGWTDVELNEEGVRQAYQVKEKLSRDKIDAIYSSPLKRAKKTAEVINENFNMDIIFSDDLKERNFGLWDDLTFKEITKKYPEDYEMWKNDSLNYCISGGESSIQAYNRIIGFIDKIVKGSSDGTFLIVTHLGSVRKIISYLLGMTIEDSWRFRVDNCTVTRIIVNDEKYSYMTQLNA